MSSKKCNHSIYFDNNKEKTIFRGSYGWIGANLLKLFIIAGLEEAIS